MADVQRLSSGEGAEHDPWLRDLEALRRLVQSYARAVDGRDFDRLSSLFHPEGWVEGARGRLSVDDYLNAMRNGDRARVSMHVLGEPLIDLLPGDDEAGMDTYGVVYQLGRPGGSTGDLVLGMRYLDQVVRGDGGRWLIMQRKATMLWDRESSSLPG